MLLLYCIIFLCDDVIGSNFTVVSGGGFVVLQERDATVVIEKAKRSEKNQLIKSGDTVIFKMLQKQAGSNDVETRFLTIHRGCWLKWVAVCSYEECIFHNSHA